MRENIYRIVFAALVILASLLIARSAFAQTLSITPTHCLAPCEVRVELRIERHKDNRWWSISFANTDGGDGGSSGGSLEGEDSEAVFPVCTQSNLRPCFRTIRESGTWLFVGCVHKLVDGKLKPFCTQKEVIVEALWNTSVLSSASTSSAPSPTRAR